LKIKWLHMSNTKTNKVSVYRAQKRTSKLHKNGHNDLTALLISIDFKKTPDLLTTPWQE